MCGSNCVKSFWGGSRFDENRIGNTVTSCSALGITSWDTHQRYVKRWNDKGRLEIGIVNFFHTFTQLQYFLFRNNKLPSGPASVERVRHFSSIVNIFLKWIFNKVKKLYTLYFHSNLNVWYTTGCVLSTKREHFLYFHNYKPTKAFERRVSSNSQFLMLVIKI